MKNVLRLSFRSISDHRLRLVSIPGLLLLFAVVGRAQDTEYQKWLKQQEAEYQDFSDKRDKEFSTFLQQEWKAFNSFAGTPLYEKPKPETLPVVEGFKEPPALHSKPVEVEIPRPKSQPMNKVKTEPVPAPSVEPASVEPPAVNSAAVDVSLFDAPLVFQYDRTVAEPRIDATISKDVIAAFWSALGRTKYEPLLKELNDKRSAMGLNDWGFTLLVYQTGLRLYRENANEAKMFTWFVLSKAGIDARVGYQKTDVYLLLPCSQAMYGVPYFKLGQEDKKYYVANLDNGPRYEGTVYSYDGNYPGANRSLDLDIKQIPRFQGVALKKDLRFIYQDKDYRFPVSFSQDAVKYFEHYPQTGFEVYFDSAPSTEASSSLASRLKPIVAGKDERDAVNMVLRFVQTAFEYKTDQDQFGREKPFFPDETLYYPYSDCEDRAILFSYLVRSMFGLEVVGLSYPNHIATAVKFHSAVPGDQIQYKGATYTICDPTYIGADVGSAMPQFKGVTPGVIQIQ
jgi:hypothetical protein